MQKEPKRLVTETLQLRTLNYRIRCHLNWVTSQLLASLGNQRVINYPAGSLHALTENGHSTHVFSRPSCTLNPVPRSYRDRTLHYSLIRFTRLDRLCFGTNTSNTKKKKTRVVSGLLSEGVKMADAQGNSASSSSSTLDSLSSVDDGTEFKHDTNLETGEEFFHDKEQEGDEEGEGEGEGEEDREDEDEDEEEANLNSAAAGAENPFQVLICAWEFSRRAEIRRNLLALRGEQDEPLNKRCTRCKLIGHVCLDCPLPLRFIPRHQRRGNVPQQNPVQPNEAHSPGQGQATIPSKGGCTGSSSQEVDPESAVPSVSSASASASQLGKRKSESGSRTGSPTGKL